MWLNKCFTAIHTSKKSVLGLNCWSKSERLTSRVSKISLFAVQVDGEKAPWQFTCWAKYGLNKRITIHTSKKNVLGLEIDERNQRDQLINDFRNSLNLLIAGKHMKLWNTTKTGRSVFSWLLPNLKMLWIFILLMTFAKGVYFYFSLSEERSEYFI